ncbi:MAG: aldo/keto reductase [Bryobacteraceae bacterium]|jgi:aryl-alcohol dehydrogenase-like predicted oxidoreductase
MSTTSTPDSRLGGTGIQTGRIGLGCVTFGREIDHDAAFAIMDYAVENGITLFDTAESYGDGASDRIVGRWLCSRAMRQRITVETKITRDFTKPHLREALNRSLERLGLDQVDIYMLHSFDASVPMEETLEGLTQAVEEGRTRFAGCSNFSAAQLTTALLISETHGFTRLRVIQPIYNLVEREIESELLPLARAQDIGVVSYSPLGAGFLSGKYASDPASIPAGSRFDIKPGHAGIYFKPGHFQVVERLRHKAALTGVPMVRLAMSWALQNPNVDCVLVGARCPAHITNALDALRMPIPAEWKIEMDNWAGTPLSAPETPPR